MRKLLFFYLFSLISLAVSAQEFKFETETINYGKVAKGSDGNRVFKFKNIGDAPLIINDIKTACDCAVPKKPTRPIMPGEEAEITVSYDTNEVGRFSKTITIFSNAGDEPKMIRIRGFVTK